MLPATVFAGKFVVVFTVGIFIPVFDTFVVKFKVSFEITTFIYFWFFKFPFICESNSRL
jgi:hypothetical protein